MSYDWTTPAAPGGSGDNVSWNDLEGALLGFHVRTIESIETRFGMKEAARVSIDVFEGGKAEASHYDDTLVFGTVLVSQLKAAGPNGRVLGRLTKGEARGGNNPPWLLAEPSPADLKLASKGEPKKVPDAESAPF